MAQPVVTVNEGRLRGCLRTDIDGGKIYSFLGVPYAKPPIGELRFKDPVPAEPWTGVRDATKEGDSCYSRELMTAVLGGSEDCLNLNIFTKSLPETKQELKPVMVWIHGGGFTSGSNHIALYGPEFLLTEDIVLVSVNYRLGALGFLSLKDSSLGVPGNAGFKDQVLALKWVQGNIKNFNGDPNNVTIFGESAGSLSAHYHVLSPASKGLFHRAILQSGSALNNWSLAGYVADKLVKNLGRDTTDEREILQILRDTPVDKLYEAQLNIPATFKASEPPYFGAVLEKPSDTAFLTKKGIDIVQSGEYNHVPIMIGYTNREMMFMEIHVAIEAMGGRPNESGTPDLEDAIPWQLNLKRGSETSKSIVQKFTDLYFKGPDPVDNGYLFATDSGMIIGIMASIKNHLATARKPIYLYRMSLDAGLNIAKHIVPALRNQPGACHCDDLGYLFKGDLTPEFKPGSLEDKSVRRFVKLWTNFARYGNPTPDKKELGVIWEPVKEGAINFLDIGKELTPGVNPEAERLALWREIYQLNPDTAQYL